MDTKSPGAGLLLRRDVPLPGRPGRGRPPRYHLDRRIPLRALAALAAAALLLLALVHAAGPHRLADTRLTGPRTLTGRACVVIAADLSGSMSSLAGQRRDAVAALLPWLRSNLAPDDLVVLVDFTDRAALALPPTSAEHLPASPPADPALDGTSTLIAPATTLTGHSLKGRGCAATELLAVSDGMLADSPAQLHDAFTAAGISRTTFLNPNGATRPYPLDQPELAGVDVVALGRTPDQISLTIGTSVARLTGQRLQKR